MKTSRPIRIKSAAFIRNCKSIKQPQTNSFKTHHFISELPVSESRFTIARKSQLDDIKRKSACSRFQNTKTSPSVSSEIWRQVHSTRSEFRLRSMQGRSPEESPVRKNLSQKVDRIKRKNNERQTVYERCLKVISKKTLQQTRLIKQQGEKGDLEKKIMELLVPFQQLKAHESQRYHARLLRIRKH